jgi:hypothetical protein
VYRLEVKPDIDINNNMDVEVATHQSDDCCELL